MKLKYKRDNYKIKKLLIEIKRFKKFAKFIYYKKSDYGWENYYKYWDNIFFNFEYVLKYCNINKVTKNTLRNMIYIIARNHEMEYLIKILIKYKDWFELLCEYSINIYEFEAKWQFAKYLSKVDISKECKKLILCFLNSKEEYVCRMAMISLPKIFPDKVEYYADLFWHRNIYNNSLIEYQKIVVLNALEKINSSKLDYYLKNISDNDGVYLNDLAKSLNRFF